MTIHINIYDNNVLYLKSHYSLYEDFSVQVSLGYPVVFFFFFEKEGGGKKTNIATKIS